MVGSAESVGLAPCMQVDASELKTLINVFGERDDAIRQGMVLLGQRYEVSSRRVHGCMARLRRLFRMPVCALVLYRRSHGVWWLVDALPPSCGARAVLVPCPQVHRHHPPLVYGRSMGGVPENSEGVAICKVDAGKSGRPCYGLITYAMPNISARMVPILHKFCTEHLAASS